MTLDRARKSTRNYLTTETVVMVPLHKRRRTSCIHIDLYGYSSICTWLQITDNIIRIQCISKQNTFHHKTPNEYFPACETKCSSPHISADQMLLGQIFKYHFQITIAYIDPMCCAAMPPLYRFLSISKNSYSAQYPVNLSDSLSQFEYSIIYLCANLSLNLNINDYK